MFSVHVIIDIKSEKSIQLHEISQVIEEALEYHRIGSVTVKKDDFYEFVAVEGKSFNPNL